MGSALGISRRRWLTGGFYTVAVVSIAPRRAEAGSEPGEARKILLLGDSMIAGAFGLYLEKDLRKRLGFEIHRRGKSSTGLARPDFHDWVRHGGRERAAAGPGAVVVMFGGNDGQGLYMGRSADPKWIRYGEPGWTEEYRRRINAFADAVAPSGEQIFWIGMPVMRPAKLHARVKHMNGLYRAEMAIRRDALFVDIWPTLAAPDGAYADKVKIDGKRTRIRAGDGVHLSGAGATLLVRQVSPLIEATLGPPQAYPTVE